MFLYYQDKAKQSFGSHEHRDYWKFATRKKKVKSVPKRLRRSHLRIRFGGALWSRNLNATPRRRSIPRFARYSSAVARAVPRSAPSCAPTLAVGLAWLFSARGSFCVAQDVVQHSAPIVPGLTASGVSVSLGFARRPSLARRGSLVTLCRSRLVRRALPATYCP